MHLPPKKPDRSLKSSGGNTVAAEHSANTNSGGSATRRNEVMELALASRPNSVLETALAFSLISHA